MNIDIQIMKKGSNYFIDINIDNIDGKERNLVRELIQNKVKEIEKEIEKQK